MIEQEFRQFQYLTSPFPIHLWLLMEHRHERTLRGPGPQGEAAQHRPVRAATLRRHLLSRPVAGQGHGAVDGFSSRGPIPVVVDRLKSPFATSAVMVVVPVVPVPAPSRMHPFDTMSGAVIR